MIKILSKEELVKKEHLDQTVQSYYNRSNNSTPSGLKSPTDLRNIAQSRQKQLLSYTVGTMAKHQRYAASKSPEDKFPQITNSVASSMTPGSLIGLQQMPAQTKLETKLRLTDIFNAILGLPSEDRELSLKRKLGMWALCLVTIAPRQCISDLPHELATELNLFKDEIENSDPIGGKVQLNPIPQAIKNMIRADSGIINHLKSESTPLQADKRIWTYPKFVPV